MLAGLRYENNWLFSCFPLGYDIAGLDIPSVDRAFNGTVPSPESCLWAGPYSAAKMNEGITEKSGTAFYI